MVGMSTGWAASRLRLRSELRRRPAGFVLLVVVIALAAGVTMAATAGARRSSTAYGRFLVWANEAEIIVGGCECTTDGDADKVLDQVQAAPFVLTSARFGFAHVVVELADGTRPSFLAHRVPPSSIACGGSRSW
jgi:hypothetical protein